jgi:hypothetical protein
MKNKDVVIRMKDIDYCLTCHKHIGKGHDLAVCDNSGCKDILEFEMNFTAWAEEQCKPSVQQRGFYNEDKYKPNGEVKE